MPKKTSLDEISTRVFFAIFFLEFLIKVIAMGFVMQKHSYLRHGWNVLDSVALMTSMTELMNVNAGDLLWLRTLRVIKPLRSIKVFP